MAPAAYENKPFGQIVLLKLLFLGLMIAYVIWEKRVRLQSTLVEPKWSGLFLLVFGLLIFFIGELGGEFFALYCSLWLSLIALIIINLGYKWIKILAFPIILPLFMFPPPALIHNNLTLRLKLLSSQIGVKMLHLYGMTAYREGNVIDLGFTQLQVVDACSGLRYLFPLIIMALLLAYFYKEAWWKKVLLVVSAVPLTIVTNSLRIAMTGVLYEVWGPKVAEGFFHGFSGWAIFIFGLAVLLFFMWGMNGFKGVFGKQRPQDNGESRREKIETETKIINSTNTTNETEALPIPESLNSSIPQFDPKTNSTDATGRSGFLKALLSPPQFVVAAILLLATLVASHAIEFREKIPPAKAFAGFPVLVGEWNGTREGMEQEFVDELDFSDYVIVDYVNGEGKTVNFYTAYYETQRKGESIHSPETCLPGGGWEFKKAGGVTLPLTTPNGKPMKVNRAFMEKGAYKQLSYFWFPQRDRILTNAFELHNCMFNLFYRKFGIIHFGRNSFRMGTISFVKAAKRLSASSTLSFG